MGTNVLETLNPAMPSPFSEVIAVMEIPCPSKKDIYNSCIFDGFIKQAIPQKQDEQNQMAMMMGQQPKPPKNIYGLRVDNRLTQMGRIHGKMTNTMILPFSAGDVVYLEPKTEPEQEINKRLTCDDMVMKFERCIIEDLIKPVLNGSSDDPKILRLEECFENSKKQFITAVNDPDNAMSMYIEDVYAVQGVDYNLYDGAADYIRTVTLRDLCSWLKTKLQNLLIIKINSLVPRPENPIKGKVKANNYFNTALGIKVHNDVGHMKEFLTKFLDYVGENQDPEFQERLAAMKKETEVVFGNAEQIYSNTTQIREVGDLTYEEYDQLVKEADANAQQNKITEGDKKHGVDTVDLVNQTIDAMKNDPNAFKLDTEAKTTDAEESDTMTK